MLVADYMSLEKTVVVRREAVLSIKCERCKKYLAVWDSLVLED